MVSIRAFTERAQVWAGIPEETGREKGKIAEVQIPLQEVETSMYSNIEKALSLAISFSKSLWAAVDHPVGVYPGYALVSEIHALFQLK